MANKVDRTGTFRFDAVLESILGKTSKSKMPSFNIRLRISEFYDEEENKWVPWSEYEVEQLAYFTLYGKGSKSGVPEPILNHAQVMKVFGWDGKSYQLLGSKDYSAVKGQIRIEDNDPAFADRNPFQVAWLDVFDASPVRKLRGLDADELKALDADPMFKFQGKAAAPAAAPGKKKGRPAPPVKSKSVAAPVKEPEPDPVADTSNDDPAELTPAEKKAAMKAKSNKIKAAGKGKKPGPPARTKTEPPVAGEQEDNVIVLTKEYTKQEAWEIVVEMKVDDVTDEQLNTAWAKAIESVAGDVDDADVTKAQWGLIVDAVLATEYEDGKTIGRF